MSARDTKENMDSMETSLRSGGGHPNNTSDEMNRELECLMADFKMEDESILTTPRAELYCPKSWDRLLCWPETSAGDLALLPCFDELQGIKYDTTQNATRMCHANGSWDSYTDYNSCNNMHLMSVEQGIEAVTTTTLTTLYFVGYSISLVAISIAIYIFIYFKDLRCLRNTIHTNLMSTYLVAEFVWILTSTLQIYMQPNTASCVVLIIVLGYFHLTNFFWMFVEGLYLYMLVVETFSGENIKLRVYVVIGWGAPAVFIVIWAIVKSVVPAIATSETQVPNPDHLLRECPWMRPHTCDWIYQAPVIAVLAVNSVFLAMIMWVLITKLRSANTVETQQYRKATKALLVLIPLLGITYILMIQGPTEGESANIFAYVRAVMISTQGFTVALFYCFLNTEVQNTVRHHLDRWKTERSIGGSRRYNYSSKDWSPRSRTESIRMYNQNNKRESTVSETTTTTLVGGTSINNDTNGSAAAMFTCGETMNTTTALLTAENAI